MSRQPRVVIVDVAHHVTQRGNRAANLVRGHLAEFSGRSGSRAPGDSPLYPPRTSVGAGGVHRGAGTAHAAALDARPRRAPEKTGGA